MELINALINVAMLVKAITVTIPTRNRRNYGFAKGVEWAKTQLLAGPRKDCGVYGTIEDLRNMVEDTPSPIPAIHAIRNFAVSGFYHPTERHAADLSSTAAYKISGGDDYNGFWKGVQAACNSYRGVCVDPCIEWRGAVVESLNARLAERF